MKLRILFKTILLLLLPFVAIAQDSFVYVSVQGSNIISVYSINSANGSLTKVEDEAVAGGPASIAISPNKKFLYVSQRTAKTFSSYSINNTTGALTFIGSVAAVDNPVNIATDITGRFLLSAYYAASKIAIHPVDSATGVITATPLTNQATPGVNPHAIKTDPSNKFLYVTNMTGNLMQQFSFDQTTGAISSLTPPTVTPAGTDGPRHFVYHGTKNLMYVSNETGNSVTVYSYDIVTGLISALQTISTLPVGYVQTPGVDKVADVHITPDNKFLYASNRGSNTIAGFIVDATTGLLTSNGYYPTQTSPRAFDMDATGSYLYAAGETSGKLDYYEINKTTGVLDSIAAYTMGSNPSWVRCLSFAPTINCLSLVTIPITGLASGGIYSMILFDAPGTTQLKVLGQGTFNAGDSNFLFSKTGLSAGTYTYKLMSGATVIQSGTIVIT